MRDIAIIIGVLFLFFSLFVFEAWRKDGREKGKDNTQGAFFAIWVLISFGFGSWAISWLFVKTGNLADGIAKSLNINVGWLLFSPLFLVFLFGLLNKFNQNKGK